jgi:alkylation response protein AidB-like acyl-CoA dehydrogenase
MDVDLSDDQVSFRDTTRRFLQDKSPLTRVRDLIEDPTGYDAKLWAQGAELGWFSMLVPEDQGGGNVSGEGICDLVIIATELGRMIFPGPVLPTNLVAAAISHSGSPSQCEKYLPAIASGATVAAWAFSESNDRWDARDLGAQAVVRDDIVYLEGVKTVVQDAQNADVLLVAARAETGLTQVLVPCTTPGVTIEPLESLDLTRRLATVRFERVSLPSTSVLGEPETAGAAIERLMQIAVVLQCAETVGTIDRTLEFTVKYAKVRQAFGRPIGSFQAVKHRLAQMLGWLEGCRAVTLAAARAVDRDVDAAEFSSAAKAYVGGHAPLITRGCLQIHGGIGYTWEHDMHLYLRRIESNRALYGSPEQHLDRVAEIVGL